MPTPHSTTAPGSEARWAVLLPHRSRLHRIATARLGDTHEAEDCTHEALIRACLFDGLDEARVGPFLTTVVVRLCADRHRSRLRSRAAMARLCTEGHHEGPEDDVCDRLTGTWMLARLGELPARERSVLQARAAGLNIVGAAQALGITTKAAESAFTRGRAKVLAMGREAC